MKILQVGNKFYVKEYTAKEGMSLKRRGVNVQYNRKKNCIEAEDNIYNRILLNLSIDFLQSSVDVDSIILSEYLREYQAIDVRKMLKYKNILNRNKMGYGKTLEAIEYCKALKLKRILVLCPKSVISQWCDEFTKWWPESSGLITDNAKIGEEQIYIINYEALDNLQRLARLKSTMWDVIICDESHRIKNPTSKRAINVKSLPTIRKIALSGTPILNRPDDLWSQLHWFGPKYSSANRWAFIQRFCEVEENHWGKVIKGLTPSKEACDLLSQALNVMTVGGDNQKVTAGKNFIEVRLDMNKEQKKLYRDVKRLALDTLNAQGITITNAMDQFIKLQQITTNPNKLSKDIKNPKFQWIKDWLEDSGDAQLVVFTKFAQTIKVFTDFIGADTCATYYGDLNAEQRNEQKKAFIEGKKRVLIGTIGALGVGVDGLQKVCSNVVFLDRDWSPAINEQAEDRVNRLGQIGMTNVYILKMRGSVDEYVEQVIKHKNDDIEELSRWIRSWS